MIAFFAAGICLLFILLRKRFVCLSGGEARLGAVQTAHIKMTPRVGGVGIIVALMVYILLFPNQISTSIIYILMAAPILFFIGLAEDLGIPISPKIRLCAAGIAGLIVVLITGIWLMRFDIPVVDSLAPYWIIGVPITLLLIAGIVHGFNLIDGVNGLAAGTAILAALSLSLIAQNGGDLQSSYFLICLAFAIFGFLILNYPFGLIFLGDAGAYTVGFILVWLGILIIFNAPSVTPWAVYLSVFWPISDTLLSIYRRKMRNAPAMGPDRMHSHQLVMRMLQIYVLGRTKRHIANSLTILILLPLVALPPIFAVIFWNHTKAAFGMTVVFTLLFWGSYFLSFKAIKKYRRSRKSTL